jgi:hypothetical protein
MTEGGLLAPQPSWLDTSTDILCDELEQLGLVAARTRVADVIRERVSVVAIAMGITERSARRYISEELLRELAREMAVSLVDEHPGVKLVEEPRTVPVSLGTLARSVEALAEVARVRARCDDPVGLQGALDLISALATILREQPDLAAESLLLPQAALTRAARLLNATAEMIHQIPEASDGSSDVAARLAEAFGRDAAILRGLAGDHGTTGGPSWAI